MSRLFRLCAVFTVILFTGQMTALAVLRIGYHNPFALYEAIMPGRSAEAIRDYPCPLRVEMVNGIESGSCLFSVAEGAFGRVTVIERAHIITRVALAVQPEALYLGDLILCWGQPTEIESSAPLDAGSLTTARWDNRVYTGHTVDPYGAGVNYFLPINYLSLENKWLSCGSVE